MIDHACVASVRACPPLALSRAEALASKRAPAPWPAPPLTARCRRREDEAERAVVAMSAGDLGCLLLCVRCESGRPLVFSSEAIGRSNASSLPAKPVAGRVLAFTKLSRAERGRQPDKRCFSAVAFAEFEEKSYEIAACGEFMRGLGGQIGHVFAPGQVLEARLGYDAAVSVSQRHPIWNVLQVPRPAGVRLLPTYWRGGKQPEAGRLPGALISLVVQFKRPEYLHAGTAAQWRYWREPYFRFARQTRQQRILRRLERAVGNDALVRYSAPAFWRWRDLEAAQLAGRVLEESGFVSPAALDRHSVPAECLKRAAS